MVPELSFFFIGFNTTRPPFDDVTILGDFASIMAPEAADRYGLPLDWGNSVGTGPFILTDFVPGSRIHMERNPNYWGTDPIGPGLGNQLPYIDAFEYLIIPDLSTRLAALRTGKIDQMGSMQYEDAETMRETAPDLLEGEGPLGGAAYYVYMNTQREPFDSLEVRRALLMAVDLELVKESLNHGILLSHRGQGLLRSWLAQELLVPVLLLF